MGRWEVVGGGGGGWASWRRAVPVIRPQTVVLCSQQTTGMYTNHSIDWDGHWQQFGNQPILISAPSGSTGLVMHQLSFTGSAKSCLWKQDLAIYSHAVDVGGQCTSGSLTLGHNLDFSSCDIMVGLCKSSHISHLPITNASQSIYYWYHWALHNLCLKERIFSNPQWLLLRVIPSAAIASANSEVYQVILSAHQKFNAFSKGKSKCQNYYY